MLLKAFIKESISSLQTSLPEEEARAIVRRLLQDVCAIPPYLPAIEPEKELSDSQVETLLPMVRRLAVGEPLQYVTGFSEFSGRRFHVAPGVLIPRPETELLCRLAADAAGMVRRPHILDLCTGSGCIAWTMALELPGAVVSGVDISEAALGIASSQDFLNEMEKSGASAPEFIFGDVLSPSFRFPPDHFDFIISNPPYVMDSEKAFMQRNVLEHEPSLALFVPDNDPLLFYRAVARHAICSLKKNGKVFVEINEALGPQTAAVFTAAGLRNAEVVRDLSGKDRFVTAVR